MTNSVAELELIQPGTLGEEAPISAWFTLKNRKLLPAGRIAGLNLGDGTSDEESAVKNNRALLLSKLDIEADRVAYARQVHGSRIQVISEGGTYASTDGLVTAMPGLTLAIQVADCAAVLLWDEANLVAGALHAGWRGAAGGIVPRGIRVMSEQGADPGRMKAFVSPCISQKHFEVGAGVAEQFPRKFVDTESYRKPHVDLKAFLRRQIREGGLKEDHIEVRDECTVEDADNLYSYRREGERSGRMMGLIQIKR